MFSLEATATSLCGEWHISVPKWICATKDKMKSQLEIYCRSFTDKANKLAIKERIKTVLKEMRLQGINIMLKYSA